MAKRPDNGHDSTMELSVSQLVVPAAPKAPPILVTSRTPPKGNPQHDMSVWKQVVVGSDDFAPPVPPKAKLSRTKLLVAAGVLVVAGAGGYVVTTMISDAPASPTVSAKPVAAPAAPVVDPAPVPPRTVANSGPAALPPAPAVAPPLAPPAAEATPPLTALDVVDAISGVAPIIEPAPRPKTRAKAIKKTAAVKKAVPKKQVAKKKVPPKRR